MSKNNESTTMYIKNRRISAKFKVLNLCPSLCLTESFLL